MKISVCGIRHR